MRNWMCFDLVSLSGYAKRVNDTIKKHGIPKFHDNYGDMGYREQKVYNELCLKLYKLKIDRQSVSHSHCTRTFFNVFIDKYFLEIIMQ